MTQKIYVDFIEKLFKIEKKITLKVNGKNQILTFDPTTHLSYFEFISIDQIVNYLQAQSDFWQP